MLTKLEGIVIKVLKYSESSLILDLYTDKYGLASFIVSGVRKPRARMSASLFQLMNWLEVVAYVKDTSTLCRIKEARPVHHYQHIPFDIQRRSIGLFMTEVFQKSIQEHESNPELFAFIKESFTLLDRGEVKVNNLHLVFLVQLSRYLGFHPDDQWSEEQPYFDLMKGTFVPLPHPAYTLEPDNSQILSHIIGCDINASQSLAIDRKHRQTIIEDLLAFYRLHLDRMADVQTHKVLAEVFG